MKGPFWQKIKRGSLLGLGVLLAISVVLSIVNSRAIHSVTVQVLDPETEVRDAVLPGMSKESALPDYRIEVIRPSKWRRNLGTILNTSAAKPLRWEIQNPIPLTGVSSLRLVDDDKLANDVIEEVQIQGESFSSAKYRYEIGIARTVGAALDYFFTTPLGVAIATALLLALLLSVLAYLP